MERSRAEFFLPNGNRNSAAETGKKQLGRWLILDDYGAEAGVREAVHDFVDRKRLGKIHKFIGEQPPWTFVADRDPIQEPEGVIIDLDVPMPDPKTLSAEAAGVVGRANATAAEEFNIYEPGVFLSGSFSALGSVRIPGDVASAILDAAGADLNSYGSSEKIQLAFTIDRDTGAVQLLNRYLAMAYENGANTCHGDPRIAAELGGQDAAGKLGQQILGAARTNLQRLQIRAHELASHARGTDAKDDPALAFDCEYRRMTEDPSATRSLVLACSHRLPSAGGEVVEVSAGAEVVPTQLTDSATIDLRWTMQLTGAGLGGLLFYQLPQETVGGLGPWVQEGFHSSGGGALTIVKRSMVRTIGEKLLSGLF